MVNCQIIYICDSIVITKVSTNIPTTTKTEWVSWYNKAPYIALKLPERTDLILIHKVNTTYRTDILYAQYSLTILHNDGNAMTWWEFKRTRPSGHDFISHHRLHSKNGNRYPTFPWFVWSNRPCMMEPIIPFRFILWKSWKKIKGAFLFVELMYRILECICDWKTPRTEFIYLIHVKLNFK